MIFKKIEQTVTQYCSVNICPETSPGISYLKGARLFSFQFHWKTFKPMGNFSWGVKARSGQHVLEKIMWTFPGWHLVLSMFLKRWYLLDKVLSKLIKYWLPITVFQVISKQNTYFGKKQTQCNWWIQFEPELLPSKEGRIVDIKYNYKTKSQNYFYLIVTAFLQPLSRNARINPNSS